MNLLKVNTFEPVRCGATQSRFFQVGPHLTSHESGIASLVYEDGMVKVTQKDGYVALIPMSNVTYMEPESAAKAKSK